LVGATLCVAATAVAASYAASTSRRTYTTRGTLPLRTALVDPFHLGSPTSFAMTRRTGAQYVRLFAYWGSNFDGSDPTSPAYHWGALDATVEAAEAEGLTPILDITGVPNWAYARRPAGVNAGTPSTAALAQFAQALATHYDGQNVDADNNPVPAVNVFEVYNEPNLSLDLGPAVSAASYREIVNAVASSVHEVDPKNLVVAGGLDPFGHKKGKKQKWYSVAPLAFMRSLLCLSKGSHPHSTCHNQIHFDIWSHHPYTFGGPFAHAKLPDDVSLGDLPKMRKLLQAAVRLHHVVSSQTVQFWVSEFGWASNPPRPKAAGMALASRWTAESLYQMWRSGVSLVTWFDLVDKASPSPYQSGLYFHAKSLENSRPKPLMTAFRFPFVAYVGSRTVRVWGRDATSSKTRVTIQRRHGKSGAWQTVGYVVANQGGIFRATLKLKATKKDWLRAVASGSGKSLAFSLTVPHAPNVGPWGG
jgi:cellulase (glycosyl hydrolase family 5)